MATSQFKGFQLVTSGASMTDKSVMYFVRTSGTKSAGTDGYIYFNGKKYGIGADAIETIKGILGTGVTSENTVTDQLSALKTQLGNYNDASATTGNATSYVGVSATTEHGQIQSITITTNVAADVTGETTTAGQLADAYQVKTALKAIEDEAKSGHTTVSKAADSEEYIVVTGATNARGGIDYTIKITGVTDAIKVAKEEAITSAETYTDTEISGLTITTGKSGGTTYVQLKNNDKEVISQFDASDFIKDGFLSGVTFETGSSKAELVFVWNTYASGGTIKNQTTRVDVSRLIDTYTVATSSQTYMDITDYVASLNVETSSALTTSLGRLADAKAVKDYVDDKVSNGAIQEVTTGKSASDTYITVTNKNTTAVTIDTTDYTNTGISKAYTAIQNGTGDTVLINVTKNSADSALTISATTKLALAVQSAETAVQVVSGSTYIDVKTENKTATVSASKALTDALSDRLTSVTVNGYTATTADTQITIATKDIKLGESITYTDKTGATGQTTGSTTTQVNTVLGDIYSKLAAAESASYSGVTATGDTNLINVSELTDDNTQNVSLLREVATTGDTGTIASGHIELNKNTDGTVYGQMYYSGNDAE